MYFVQINALDHDLVSNILKIDHELSHADQRQQGEVTTFRIGIYYANLINQSELLENHNV